MKKISTLLLLLTVGCNSKFEFNFSTDIKHKIVGPWYNDKFEIISIYHQDGTMTLNSKDETLMRHNYYKIDNQYVTNISQDNTNAAIYKMYFINDDSLHLLNPHSNKAKIVLRRLR